MADPSLSHAFREIAALHSSLADRYERLATDLEGEPMRPTPTPVIPDRASGNVPPPVDVVPATKPLLNATHFPPDSMRGHAERALIEEGGPLPLDEWANRVRAQGFAHDWDPRNPRQLEASLSALPHQTAVFVRVGRRIYDLGERHTSPSQD